MAHRDSAPSEGLFQLIADDLSAGDYKRCAKHAEAVLRQTPDDMDAARVLLHAMIMTSRWNDALQLVATKPFAAHDVAREKAYCLWKLGRLDDALQEIDHDAGVGALHLKAQLYLRRGDSAASVDVYHALISAGVPDKQSAIELATSASAAAVIAGDPSEAKNVLSRLRVAPESTYETAFNVACAAIEAGDVEEAQKMLDVADVRGQESLLEDGASEQAVDRELAVIRAQLAHVVSLRGDTADALTRYGEAQRAGAGVDVALAALCANNVLVLRTQSSKSDAPPKDAMKQHSAFFQEGARLVPALSQRLSRRQAAGLSFNRVLLALRSLQAGGVAAMSPAAAAAEAAALAAAAPDDAGVMIVHATATAVVGAQVEVALGIVDAWQRSHPSVDSLETSLLAAHLALCAKPPRRTQAMQILRSLPERHRFKPALVATRMALLEREAGSEGAGGVQRELEEALAWWMSAEPSGEATTMCSECLQRLGALCLSRGAPSDAAAYFRQIEAFVPNLPPLELLSVSRCLAAVDPVTAAALRAKVEEMTPVPTSDVLEAEALDLSFIRSKGASVLFDASARPDGKGDVEGAPARKKRKRKPRYPKGFDPDNPGPLPDKERWLPKYERSEYKKRRKNKQRNQPVSKGAQGTSKVDASLDKSGVSVEAEAKGAVKLPTRTAPRGAQGKRKGRR